MAAVEERNVGFEGFSGEVLRPGEQGYDEARRVQNGMIDKRPGLIARCRGIADIVAAVNHAREQGARSRSAAAGTTWPAGPSPRVA